MTQAATSAAATTSNGNGNAIIELENIRKYFPVTRGVLLRRLVGEVRAVDGISFQIKEGETYNSTARTPASSPDPNGVNIAHRCRRFSRTRGVR